MTLRIRNVEFEQIRPGWWRSGLLSIECDSSPVMYRAWCLGVTSKWFLSPEHAVDALERDAADGARVGVELRVVFDGGAP